MLQIPIQPTVPKMPTVIRNIQYSEVYTDKYGHLHRKIHYMNNVENDLPNDIDYYESKVDRITSYICPCCGAPINPRNNQCEYCGIYLTGGKI